MLTPASSRWRIKVCRRRIETRTRPSLRCKGRNRENSENLRVICADPAMPARATVFHWLARNQEFRRSYALARQCHAEDFAFETLAIADDSSRDYVKMTGVDGKVTWVFDRENFARQRLRIEARKMILARMTPRKYGNP